MSAGPPGRTERANSSQVAPVHGFGCKADPSPLSSVCRLFLRTVHLFLVSLAARTRSWSPWFPCIRNPNTAPVRSWYGRFWFVARRLGSALHSAASRPSSARMSRAVSLTGTTRCGISVQRPVIPTSLATSVRTFGAVCCRKNDESVFSAGLPQTTTTEACGAGLVRHLRLILCPNFQRQSRTCWKKSLKLHVEPAGFAELRERGATMKKVCNWRVHRRDTLQVARGAERMNQAPIAPVMRKGGCPEARSRTPAGMF